MRQSARRVLATISLLPLLALAGGCHGTTSGSTTTSTTVPAPGLLTLGDVGTSWKVGPQVTDETFADATQIPCTGMSLDAAVAARLRPTLGVQFEPVNKTYLFLSELVTIGNAEGLSSDLNTYVAAEKVCAETPNNGLLEFKEIAFPSLGDQSSAWLLSAYDNGSSSAIWHIRAAVVRVGGTIVNVNLTEALETPTQDLTIPDSEFRRLVTVAVSKVTAAQ